MIDKGIIGLYDTFAKAEEKVIYQVEVFFDNRPTVTTVVPSELISDEKLPEPGEFLDMF